MSQHRIAFTPGRIAELVVEPGKTAFEPTDEQKLVITAPQGTPLLVVAGAGSGKTETMSQRVIWLVANGFVTPDQVLGLTFTKKAAGELSERIRTQLFRLRDALADAPESRDPERADVVSRVRNTLLDQLSIPQVSTYNSFAGSIIAEFGELAGIQSDATVIDDATAWRLAREVVKRTHDPRLIETDIEPNSLIELVLKINRATREHLVARPAIEQLVVDFLALRALPYSDGGDREKSQPDVASATAALENLPLLLDLADAFAEAKQRRGLIEFSDQVALALFIVKNVPTVRDVLRERFSVVLLDEYQDTSVGQTQLLAQLFADHGVTAVGDPHQSIYGWRGASAANLAEYAETFGVTLPTLSLSTSWRNSVTVLDAANTVIDPLTQQSPIEVKRLQPRPGAVAGAVTSAFLPTVTDEAAAIARWLGEKRAEFYAREHRYPTCAIIHRQRALMPVISAALTDQGVPNEIVGVGGLLTTPEVTDILSVLRCLWQVDAGSELIRLLAGPRWRVGVADLDGLRQAAFWLSERDHALQKLSDEERDAQRLNQLPNTQLSIVEALDVICSVNDDHAVVRGISRQGLARMRELGDMLISLRSRLGAPLSDLVRQVETELRLDIELVANETSHRQGGRRARANLDAFADLVDTFSAIDDEGTLASFLAYIDRALRDDAAAEQSVIPDTEAVQLVTVHGAKGLEWDYVVVPRMVTDEFPSRPKGLSGWLSLGELPYELRGDAHAQPQLAWRSATTKLEFKKLLAAYRDQMRIHLANEERRLAYVALTRAREEMFVTGSYWSSQKTARMPSTFLSELADADIIAALPDTGQVSEKPAEGDGVTVEWPPDPLGSRKSRVHLAAAAVHAVLDGGDLPSVAERNQRYPELGLLLAEQERASAQTQFAVPERVSASAFKDFVVKPQVALNKLQRPMPERPYRQAKIGTLFHQWVERRYATAVGSAEELDLDGAQWQDLESDDAPVKPTTEGDTKLAELKSAFEASPWGRRAPFAIEREITVPFAGRSLVCKLDAIYKNEDGTYEIVDWKTGSPPKSDAEREERMLQLELYRHAFAQWQGVEPSLIQCTLFYVAAGEILRSSGELSFDELERQWLQAVSEVTEAASE